MSKKAQSSDAKLDALIASVDALTRSQEEMKSLQEESKNLLEASLQRVKLLEDQVNEVTANQAATTAHLSSHDRDINFLKQVANSNDQLHRANNLRILGFPVLDGEITALGDGGVYLRNIIFHRLLQPVFEAAVRDRFILAPPAAQEAIVKIHRAGRPVAGTSASPPPIIVTVSSPLLRLAVFRYKSKSLPGPNPIEKGAGAKRFYVVEDLTRPTHRMMKSLQDTEGIEKVWTTDGVIRFKKTGDDSIFKVANVFDSVENIINT